jgi:predicted component of type VI protein secretion system
VNYVLVNGRQFAPDSSTTVRAGDRIEMGQYSLELLTGALDETSHDQTVKMAASAFAPGNALAARPGPPRGKGLIESLAEEAPIVRAPAAAAARPVPLKPEQGKPEQELLRSFMEGAGIASFQPPRTRSVLRECGAAARGD